MALISPYMESAANRLVDRLARDVGGKAIPDHVRAAMRAEQDLPGAGTDPIFHIPGLTADSYWYTKGLRTLEDNGFQVRAMRMPWHGFDGIPSDAKQVRPQVERYLEHLNRRGIDADRVHGSGDSEGGLIFREALRVDEKLRPLVSNFTSNGTPHNGIRLAASDRLTNLVQKLPITPPGARDLLVTSPVMHRLNVAWDDTLAAMVELDPNFRVHSVASRTFGHDHDVLVPVHSAWLKGDEPIVTNYLTEGGHSLALAFGREKTANFQTLMATFGSKDPVHIAAARHANAVHQAWVAQRTLG